MKLKSFEYNNFHPLYPIKLRAYVMNYHMKYVHYYDIFQKLHLLPLFYFILKHLILIFLIFKKIHTGSKAPSQETNCIL